jgi:hypothetical protein
MLFGLLSGWQLSRREPMRAAGLRPGSDDIIVGIDLAEPRIARIFVRALTPASHGNACGLAYVDVSTARLVEAIDLEATAVNAITSCVPEDVRIPLTVPTERDAVAVALATIRPREVADLRIVQIANTSEVTRLLVSQGCLSALEGREDIEIGPDSLKLRFDPAGNLLSPLSDAWARSAGKSIEPTV